MRKIFSILAAAIIALSFASCEKADVGAKYFKIRVTDITDSSAVISVTPADTSMIYLVTAYPTADIERYTLDTIVSYLEYELEDYLDYKGGATLEDLVAEGSLFQRPFGPKTIALYANTAWTVLACELLQAEDGAVSVGRVATKKFTTKKVQVVETIDLGVLQEVGCDDDRESDGSFGVWGTSEDGAYAIEVWFFDEDLKGSYDFNDIGINWSGISNLANGEGFSLADAKLVGTYVEATGAGKLEGWVVANNGVKYKFTANYVLEPEGDGGRAPRRAIKKDAVKVENGILPKIPTVFNRVKK